MQPAKQIKYVIDPHKFDLRTHVWDNQGHLVSVNHYRKFILSGSEYYERPVNSGNLWFENNEPAGRVICTFNDKGHIVTKEFDFKAEHIEYIPAPTGAEKLAYELAAAHAKNAQLEAELKAIGQDKRPVPTEEASVKTAPPTLNKRRD